MSYLGGNPDALRTLDNLKVDHIGVIQQCQIHAFATLSR